MSQYVKNMKDDELMHYGVLGMRWGVRKSENKPFKERTYADMFMPTKKMADKANAKSAERRYQRKVNKTNKVAKKQGRLIDTGGPKVYGVKQKSGDILFVDRDVTDKRGIDEAEKQALALVKKGKQKTNKFLTSNEKTLVKDMIKNYDTSAPDYDEAIGILQEIERDLK